MTDAITLNAGATVSKLASAPVVASAALLSPTGPAMQRGLLAVADDLDAPRVLHDGAIVGHGLRTILARHPVREVHAREACAPEDIIFINGINTPQDSFVHSLDAMAHAAQGAHVLGVYNASRGPGRDFIRGYFDHLFPRANPAIVTMARALEHVAAAKRPIVIVAHSQGAAVTAQALRIARDNLLAKHPPKQVAEMLSSMSIETHGAAGCNFIDGPRYVHYINTEDPVPHAMGLSKGLSLSPLHRPGKNAVFRYFTHVGPVSERPVSGWLDRIFSRYDDSVHSMRIYGQHRVPFAQAYYEGSNDPGPAEAAAAMRWSMMRFIIDVFEAPMTVKEWTATLPGNVEMAPYLKSSKTIASV